MILYDYFRSSASFRVRIALNLKQLKAEQRSVHLLKKENLEAEYKAINPQGLVPYFVDGAVALPQSLAIIEYLDEIHPEPALLPATALDRAWVRAVAQLIACDIHPVNNKRILDYLKEQLDVDDQGVKSWYLHWIMEGFDALEPMLVARAGGNFCLGATPTLADICLVPQVFNAQRFKTDMSVYPRISRVFAHCMKLAAFDAAQPSKHPHAS